MTQDGFKQEMNKLFNKGGTYGPSRIRVYAAAPAVGGHAVLLNWDEPDNDIMNTEVEQVGSALLMDYGLDEPPGQGVWVFEGTVSVAWSKGGHPEDPPEYDQDISWEGEWRPPNDDENAKWAAHKAIDVTDDYDGKGSPDATPEIETPKPRPISYDSSSKSSGDFCDCGKHVSECCCGESHGPYHPSGRAYDDEEWEQFLK